MIDHPFVSQTERYSTDHQLFKSGDTIIVGLSGGPDSVCLLSVLKKLSATHNVSLIAAHLDHQWRATSAQDAQFCRELCATLDIPLFTAQADQIVLTKKYNGSPEERGRQLRRAFFKTVQEQTNAQHIALAHHADDQIETFLLRLIRGASLTGLASMRVITGLYIRPLLWATKKEILAYLADENLSYCIDETNADERLLRNALRNAVIPAIQSVDSRFTDSCLKAIDHLQKSDRFIQQTVDRLFDSLIDKETSSLDYTAFLQSDSYLHHSILVKWLCMHGVQFTPSTSLFNEIIRFFKNDGQMHITSNWAIEKKKNKVLLIRK